MGSFTTFSSQIEKINDNQVGDSSALEYHIFRNSGQHAPSLINSDKEGWIEPPSGGPWCSTIPVRKVGLGRVPEVVLNGIDSRVCLGSWAKGRSSVVKLNNIWRQCLGLGVLADVKMLQFWLESAANPADDS